MPELHGAILSDISIGGKSFRVLRFEMEEKVSELGFVECEFFDDAGSLPRPLEIIDKKAVFSLQRHDGAQVRRFAGRIISAELGPDNDDVLFMRVIVAPVFWNLKKRAGCRIFQHKSGPDIVRQVLTDAGISDSEQEFRLVSDHPEREYTVQYRESDLDFVLRLCFEEGISFAVHTIGDAEKIIFFDNPKGMGDIEGETVLPFFEQFGFEGSADRIFSIQRTHSVVSDKVYVRDYNFEKPALDLKGEAESTDDGPHPLEVYSYPARAADNDAANRIARILLDSIQAGRDVVEGESGSLALVPGLCFSLDSHPYEPMNENYLIVRSHISGSRPRTFDAGSGRNDRMVCKFWAIPTEKSPLVPERRERAQVIPGAQTGFITGPSGSEIHTDSAGRVKVFFHWDREGKKDDTSSLWIRTSQVPIGGSVLLPRVGWEVNLRFHEGDPDRPAVMGRVYNALTPPPYGLPKQCASSSLQTATTPGGGSSNEIRMGDDKGKEEMFFNASKDMSLKVNNNSTESVGHDSKKTVGSNQSQNVTNSVTQSIGSNQSISVGGNQDIKVETFKVDDIGGDHSLQIGGNRDMKIGGDHKQDVGGSSSLSVGGNKIDLVVGSVSESVLGSYTHQVGAAKIEMSLGDRVLTVQGSNSQTVGALNVIATKGGRGVDISGSMMSKTGGAQGFLLNGDKTVNAGGTLTEVAAGASIIKADNVIFEADGLLSFVMGASTITLTPASVSIAGVSIKIEGATAETSALILDN